MAPLALLFLYWPDDWSLKKESRGGSPKDVLSELQRVVMKNLPTTGPTGLHGHLGSKKTQNMTLLGAIGPMEKHRDGKLEHPASQTPIGNW